jgi:hypothetical protein
MGSGINWDGFDCSDGLFFNCAQAYKWSGECAAELTLYVTTLILPVLLNPLPLNWRSI